MQIEQLQNVSTVECKNIHLYICICQCEGQLFHYILLPLAKRRAIYCKFEDKLHVILFRLSKMSNRARLHIQVNECLLFLHYLSRHENISGLHCLRN